MNSPLLIEMERIKWFARRESYLSYLGSKVDRDASYHNILDVLAKPD